VTVRADCPTTAAVAGSGFTRNTDQTTIPRCSNDGLARVRIATKRPPAAFAIAAALIGMFVVSRAVAAPSDFDGVWLPDVKDQKRQETQNVPPWKPEIVPQIWGAFVVAVSSGGLLFISNATKYLANGFFIAKLLLIGAAGLNMLVFHAVSARDLPKWDDQARLPLSARLAGALSICLWIAVVACGRWIGFTMPDG
jgi:uncharacterized membrane protein